jgi:hypothetical protein
MIFLIIGLLLFIIGMVWNTYLGDEGKLWKVNLSAYMIFIGDFYL